MIIITMHAVVLQCYCYVFINSVLSLPWRDICCTGCSFFNNKSERGGSAVVLYYNNNFFKMLKCSVFKNSAGQDGSIIVFSSNNYIAFDECHIYDNIHYQDGGALKVVSDNDHASVQNSIVENNVAIDGNGGGMSFATGNRYLHIINVTIQNNTAYGTRGQDFNGGGVFFGEQHYFLTLRNVKVLSNVASGTGGGMVVDDAVESVQINECTFHGNQASKVGDIMHDVCELVFLCLNTLCMIIYYCFSAEGCIREPVTSTSKTRRFPVILPLLKLGELCSMLVTMSILSV